MLHVSVCLLWWFCFPKCLQQLLKGRCSEFLNRGYAWRVDRSFTRCRTWWFINLSNMMLVSVKHRMFQYTLRGGIFKLENKTSGDSSIVLPYTLLEGIFLHYLWSQQSCGNARCSNPSTLHNKERSSNQDYHMPHDQVVMNLHIVFTLSIIVPKPFFFFLIFGPPV